MSDAENRAPGGAADGEGLPGDIAFLLRHDVPHATLVAAARAARTSAVPACDALLARGLLGEERFYRALAAEIGAPFLATPRLGPHARMPESLLAGRAPLAPGPPGAPATVAAPRGAAVGALVARGRAPNGLALATPRALREAMLALHGAAVARRAAHGLADRTPHFSYRGGPSIGQRRTIALVALAILAGAAVLDGVLVALGALACVLFVVLATIRFATCLESVATAPLRAVARIPDADLPVYTILVPLADEARVVRRLAEDLLALDYPPEKLDIKLLVEADDGATAAAIDALSLPGAFETIVVPPGEPRTKPRALNAALPLARGTFTVVFDAEDRPERDQLRLAVAAFDRERPDLACLQARLAIHNARDGWLPALFAIEYAALFDVINPGLIRLGLPIPLGGTSNHFRTAPLRAIGGWDAWNVTEDADIGLRLAALGLRTGDLPSATWEEAPTRLGQWLNQRSRWMKGFVQTLLTHTRDPRRSIAVLGARRVAIVWLLVGGTVLSALLYPLTLVVVASLVAGGIGAALVPGPDPAWVAAALAPLPLPIAILATTTCAWGLATTCAVAGLALRRRGRRDLVRLVPTIPLYLFLVSVGAWRGLHDLVRRPYHWHKTSHGLPPPPTPGARLAARWSRIVHRRGSGRREEAPAE
ncbi:glycosyltransferase [Salinarimonas rosea]|uniref:glycosyltransferase n=1 Tax=Salinarimonas rosea TaxID=552063 RepID=UPI0004072C50|nr:glycosyltransferase [Salinarimonas rosea]